MVHLASFVILLTIVVQSFCYDGIYVGDLPSDTAKELKYLIEVDWPELEEDCIGHPVVRKADFMLYTRDNPTIPILLDGNNLATIDPKKDIKVLIHGWLSSASSSGTIKLRDAYLKRYDCNVISVGWTEQAFQSYSKAYCDVQGIGYAVSQFLCTVNRQLNIPLDKVHILGHSHGAHAAGFTGKYVPVRCNQKIGRITGLDPSGPIFQYSAKEKRLDQSDALFVDVIHTNYYDIGIYANSGTVDFHVNCGLLQPGCPRITEVTDGMLVSHAICSSLRSIEYMVESIRSNNFIAISCSSCPFKCSHDIRGNYAVMGEECRQEFSRPAYTIPTNDHSPYALGWDPYDLA